MSKDVHFEQQLSNFDIEKYLIDIEKKDETIDSSNVHHALKIYQKLREDNDYDDNDDMNIDNDDNNDDNIDDDDIDHDDIDDDDDDIQNVIDENLENQSSSTSKDMKKVRLSHQILNNTFPVPQKRKRSDIMYDSNGEMETSNKKGGGSVGGGKVDKQNSINYHEVEDYLMGIKRKKKQKRLSKKIPKDVDKLIGEANLNYICNDFKKATEQLLEAIRLAPNIPDAYHTLSLIYNDLKQYQKSLQCLMLAALLTPKDLDLWRRVAYAATEQGYIQQSIYCLSRIIRHDPKNTDALYDRSILYLKCGKITKATEGFQALLKVTPKDFSVITQLAKLYHQQGMYSDAIVVLRKVIDEMIENAYKFQKSGDIRSAKRIVNLTLVNMLCELYLLTSSYIELSQLVQTISSAIETKIQVLPPDLKVKFAISLLYQGKISEADEIFKPVLHEQVSRYGDLFFDIAEAYFSVGEYHKALKIYQILLNNGLYSDPNCWYRVAECYRHLNDIDKAIHLYSKVIDSDPNHADSRLQLSELYKQKGDIEKAVHVLGGNFSLSQGSILPQEQPQLTYDTNHQGFTHLLLSGTTDGSDSTSGIVPPLFNVSELNPAINSSDMFFPTTTTTTILSSPQSSVPTIILKPSKDYTSDIRVLVRKAWLHFQNNNYEAFIKTLLPFIFTILNIEKKKKNKKIQRKYLEQKPSIIVDEELSREWTWPKAVEVLGDDHLFHLLVTLCKVLGLLKRYHDAKFILQKLISETGVYSGLVDRLKQLRVLSIAIAFKNEDYTYAYTNIKPILLENPYNVTLWNLFNRITTNAGNFLANHKFLLRTLQKFPQCSPIMILIAHYCAMTSSYRLALGEYFRAFKLLPNEPLILLCIGINYLNLVMNRRVANRHLLVMQAFTFFYKYYQAKNGDQEANYNIARAYHQLGLNHFAVHYYEKVLAQKCNTKEKNKTTIQRTLISFGDKSTTTHSDQNIQDMYEYSLKREAAFNLVYLYKKCGNIPLAKSIMETYLVIE